MEISLDALNSVLCSFYDIKIKDKADFKIDEADLEKLISIQFVTPDLLKEGYWEVIGNVSPINPNDFFEYDRLKADGYIGANIRGSGGIRKFLSAYQGVYHWNCYYKDDYFDELLLDPENKPDRIYFIEK